MALIIGIDPGSRITGYGIINWVGNTREYVDSGCIRIQGDILAERLHQIYKGVTELITAYSPQYMAIEKVFMARNPDSALKLGQARGVAMVAGANQGLPVSEYSARQVKQAVVLDVETGTKVMKLIDMLEELDDVQSVSHNAEMPDEVFG